MQPRFSGTAAGLLVGIIVTVTIPRPAEAGPDDEPYLALRTGLKCSACHVNRTGGGGRNDFGSAWAQTQLPMKTLDIRSRRLNDWIAIGTDLRARASATVSDATPQTTLELNEAQIQLEARFLSDKLSVYLDETVGPEDAFAREAFAMAVWPEIGGYAKAGKFLLPFGWRLWDDEAFIRSETGFTYQRPDVGFEIGLEPGPLEFSLALSNGNPIENNDDKMVTTRAALVFPRFRFGASASRNSSPDSRTEIVGGFAGFSVGPFVLLGQTDWILGSFDTQPDRDQFAAYVEGDLLLRKGWNAKVTYGFHDPNLDVEEDQRIRMRFGLEVFPVSFVQVSGFYTLRDDIPQRPVSGQDRISLEVHLHF